MNMSKLKSFLTVLALVFTISMIWSQEPFKAIVLINGDPFIVDLAGNGSILVRYQRVPDYFSSTTSDLAIIDQYSRQGLIAEQGLDFYREQIDSPSAATTEVMTGEQYIEFSQNRAVLNREAVDQVRAISDAFQEGRFRTVTIVSYHHDTLGSRTLAQNRSKAIADLLNTFGVPLENIIIELPYNARGSDISFVNLRFAQ